MGYCLQAMCSGMRWSISFVSTVILEPLYSREPPPVGDEGEVGRSENKFGAILRDQALSQMRQLVDSGYQGPVFLGSAKADGKVMHLGDWSEVLPWSPINKSLI